MSDKAKEAIKARNKQKFKTELEKTNEETKRLEYELINLESNITNAEDIDSDVFSIINGIRRDLLLAHQNIKRIERLLKIGCDECERK